jgi:pSer/pThr/pTyr-binding forkhead associated (FHA) protein
VSDPIIARFAEACGASAPLHLRVDLAEGSRRAEGTVAMPFTLVGRDDACDVTLTDPEVNPRHAWLQVVGGRVLAVDLGSRTGLAWPGQGTGSGWLDVGVPMRIGPFQIRLCAPVSTQPIPFAHRYSPLQSDPLVLQSVWTFSLEFRNGKRARDRWTVNRLITLVGRASECKIRLSADDIAAYHCGLVLTPTSLWVVDLSGRGVVVNGERMRVSPLAPGAELWIGRFLIGLHAKSTTFTLSSERGGIESPSVRAAIPPGAGSFAEPSEDEVPLGVAPPRDPHAGLPSSHIMADAFPIWGAGPAGVSNPILITGSEPPHEIHPVVRAVRSTATQQLGPKEASATKRIEDPRAGMSDRPLLDSAAATTAASLLRQLGELHGQILTQFEQSLGLMVRLFACLEPDQLPPLQQELARIQELNAELGHLQAELARRAADIPATSTSFVHADPPHDTIPTALNSTALHDWVADRINSLQKERQARWQSLVGLFASTESR